MGDGRWEMGEGGWGEGRWGLRYFPSSESLGFRLRSSDFRLLSPVFRLRSSDFGLRSSVFGLPTSVFRLPSSLPADAVRQASSNFHLSCPLSFFTIVSATLSPRFQSRSSHPHRIPPRIARLLLPKPEPTIE